MIVQGDAAWAHSTLVFEGTRDGRPVNFVAAELVGLAAIEEVATGVGLPGAAPSKEEFPLGGE